MQSRAKALKKSSDGYGPSKILRRGVNTRFVIKPNQNFKSSVAFLPTGKKPASAASAGAISKRAEISSTQTGCYFETPLLKAVS